jgi:hypothetical protein
MDVGVAEGFGAALVGLHYLMKHSYLRAWFESGRLRFSVGDSAGSAGMLWGLTHVNVSAMPH